ncbi:MAG: hypothetical protein R3E79_12940 [Caldilineaceae bacterium]
MAKQTTAEAVAEIWKLFRDTDARFKETDAKFKETDAKFKETDAKFKETDAKFKETDTKLRRLEGLFGNQWGRLLEALVQPAVLTLFQERGYQVRRLHQRSKTRLNGRTMEIDLILEDQTEVVVVEVKSIMTVEHISDFLSDLAVFTDFFPLYKGYHIYGAVAGLDVSEDVARYAYRRGLFVLRVAGNDMVQIDNDEDFRPRDFSQ